VAAEVHRTPTHVAATIKAATGYSVGQWISAGRVAEAAARLAHTDESIDQITTRVGWQDTTHFIRQFRKAYGSTPAAWRRLHRARHGGPPASSIPLRL
jgi:AraC-like DNA-binding protein